MTERIYKETVYEKYDGTPHTFEVFAQYGLGAAPYAMFLDGAFFVTTENGPAMSEEIEDTINWFGWSRTNPMWV